MPSRNFSSFASVTAGLALLAGLLPVQAADVQQLKPKPGPKPFNYVKAPGPLPNYVAGAKWGTQAEPIQTMQEPLSPEASMARIVLPEGFSASLFAAEPDIKKPVAMAWDERGRLWISETIDYPNEQQPNGEGRDRITICEDTNGDGKADKFTVFADKLSIPTTLAFVRGGLIVMEGGHVLFLKDTDGDDKADVREVLFSGWGMNDTHATASNFRYGFDNQIWGTVGYSGFNGTVGGQQNRFGQGVYRFTTKGDRLEFVRSSNNNTWGLGLSEDGTIFGSTANNNAAWYMAIPNRFYEGVSGWSASVMGTIADSQQIYPITDKVRQVDQHNKYTAGAGSALYTARSFPKEFWNRISFISEPTGHLTGFYELNGNGADFTARNRGTFLASDDEWTAPIIAEVGPEGALWVVDWYNYIIQHNPVPNGFKNGKGNAYETPLRDKRHGRIYRVTHDASKPTTQPARLDKATPTALVETLRNENQLWRMHAQRLLVERGQKDVVPALAKLVADSSVDSIGLNVGAIHALWTLNGLGATSADTISAGLAHKSAGVRRAAVQVAPRTGEFAEVLLKRNLLFDGDSQVRLATLLALAESPASASIAKAIATFIGDAGNAGDRWLREGAISAGARNDREFLKALVAAAPGSITPEQGEVLQTVSRHFAHSGSTEELMAFVASLKSAHESRANAALEGLIAGWENAKTPTLTPELSKSLTELMTALPDAAKTRLLALSRSWGKDAETLFAGQRASILDGLAKRLADASLATDQRVTAANGLIRLEDNAATATKVLDQVSIQAEPKLVRGLFAALADGRAPSVGDSILERWTKFTPAQRRAALGTLTRRPEWSGALLGAIEEKKIPGSDLGPEVWQQLRQSRDRRIAAQAARLADAGKPISADREAVVKRLLPVAKLKGDPERGKAVYAQNCAVCHTLDGQGGKVGPELTGIGARDRADILTEILDPNRSVEANYRLWNVTTKDGETLSGRLDAETQTAVEILDLSGTKHSVQRKDIASLESSPLSIMPTGFEQISESDLAALLEHLAHSNHPPGK